jgi:sugar phosphate isomerase/epimerase
VVPHIRRLADYAGERGVKICSENHGRIMQDSDRMEELFYQVDHENYGLLCDMGNFGVADENYVRAVSRLLPQVCFVHAKDAFHRSGMMYDPGKGFRRTRGGDFRRATIFGHGDVPTYQILYAIKKSGYDGYVSIEFEGIEDPLMAVEISADNLKRMVADLER